MKKDNRLTSKEFWSEYWSQSKIRIIEEKTFFKDLIHLFPKAPVRFIEMGGFPGSYSVYFKKYHAYDVTLLDFVIEPKAIKQIEQINQLPIGEIKCIAGDLFDLPIPLDKYDVVFSAGLIEHFKDSKPVFKKHLDYLKDEGTLFVSVPNFKGIQGFIQKFIDRKNYDAHSLECMEINYFKNLADEYLLEIQFLDYYGTPHLWLDSPEIVPSFYRRCIRLLSMIMEKSGRLFKFKNRLLSPYIILIAKKKKL